METDKVFHRLRVSVSAEDDTQPPPPKNLAQDSETHVLYNGISANTWLMPIGVVTRRRSTGGVGLGNRIHEECRKTVAQRAHSASLMLGQRPHVNTKSQAQPMPSQIQGTHVGPDPISNRLFTSKGQRKISMDVIKTRPPMKFSDRAVPLYRKNEQERIQNELRVVMRLRPKTAPLLMPKKELLHDNLTIVKLETAPKDLTDEDMPNHRCVSGADFVEIFLNEANMGNFTSASEMSAAYRAYMNIPSDPETLHVNTPNETRLSSAASRRSRQRSATSRQSQTVPRARSARNRFDSPQPPTERPRSSWRPLMGSEENNVHGSMGCNHRCRQCFSACLASEDYLDHVQDPAEVVKQRNPNKKKPPESTSQQQRSSWGVKSGRKRLKAIVRDHPEGEGDGLLGLSIRFFSPTVGSHEESLDAMTMSALERESTSEFPELSLSRNSVEVEIKGSKRKKGHIRSIGHIAKGISSTNHPPAKNPNTLRVHGASLQEQDEGDIQPPQEKKHWDFFHLRTFQRPGILAPLPTYQVQEGMGHLTIHGSPKPQHRRADDQTDDQDTDDT